MRPVKTLLGLLLLMYMHSGCVALRSLVGAVAEKPQVKLSHIEVQAFAVNKIEMTFVLDAFNPNSFALDVEKLDYTVSGLGMELGKGKLEKAFLLEGKEKSQLRLPFAVEPEVALKIMKKYISHPAELKLRVQGGMQLDTAFGRFDMPFDEEKAVLKGLPGF